MPRGRLVAVLCFLALVLFPVIWPYETYYQTVLFLTFIFGVQAVAEHHRRLRRYVSLGHSAFLGIGSYTAAIIALHAGVNPLLVAPVGGVVAVVMAC